MAFAERAGSKNTGEAGNADTCAVAFSQNVVAGNLLVTGGGLWQAETVTSVTVTGSLHPTGWTIYFVSVSGGFFTAWLAWKVATSSGAETVTVNGNAAVNWYEQFVNEYTAGAAIELDVAGASTQGSGTAVSHDITTTSSNGLIVGTVTTDATVAITPGGSYVEIGEDTTGANCDYNAVHRITSVGQLYAVDWTIGSSGWVALAMAFKEAGVSAPIGPHLIPSLMVGKVYA